MSGTIPLLPLYVFMAWTGTTVPFDGYLSLCNFIFRAVIGTWLSLNAVLIDLYWVLEYFYFASNLRSGSKASLTSNKENACFIKMWQNKYALRNLYFAADEASSHSY
jgi:hypothetical protein